MKRREYLTASGAVLTTVPLAGCSGDDSGDSENGQENGDGSSGIEYESGVQWAAAPEEFGDEVEHYRMFSTAPATVAEHTASLDSNAWDAYQRKWLDWNIADPDAEDVTRYLEAQDQENDPNMSFVLAEHELDGRMLAESLGEMGFEQTDEHEGYDIYEDGTSARALGNGVLMAGVGAQNGVRIVEALIDSGEGNVDRYPAVNDDVASALEAIDTQHNFRFRSYREITSTISQQGVFAGSVARAQGSVLSEEMLDVARVEVLTPGRQLEQSAIDNYTENHPLFNSAQNLETNTESNRLLFDWSVDLGNLNLDQLG